MIRPLVIAFLGIPVMVVGLIAWIMPFIPGAPIFFLGLAMVIGWHPAGVRFISYLRTKFKIIFKCIGLNHRTSRTVEEDLFRPEETKVNVKSTD